MALLGGLAAALTGFEAVPRRPKFLVPAALAGAAFLAGAPWVLGATWRALGVGAVPTLGVIGGGLAAAGLGFPLVSPLRRAGAAELLVALAVAGLVIFSGRVEIGVACALLAAVGVARTSPPYRHAEPASPGLSRRRRPLERGLRAGAAAVVAGALGLAWAALRGPLEPSAAASQLWLGAAAVGWLVGRRGNLAVAVGALLLGGGTWAWQDAFAGALPVEPREALALVAGLGLAGGLAVSGLTKGRAPLVATLGALGALLWIAPRLDRSAATAAARVQATVRGDQLRADALRDVQERWSRVHVALAADGASSLHTRAGQAVAVVDGTAIGSSGRSAQAERFAAVLGSCLTEGRERARLAGDDLGLATLGLADAGFLAVDVSTPEPAYVRALSGAAPALQRAWLTPAFRLQPVSHPALLHYGPTADLVVQVQHQPWTDARSPSLGVETFRAVRRGLRAGGAYVAVVPARTLAAEQLARVSRDFVRVFPGGHAWLPPAGVDTVLLAARLDDGPLPWAAFDACAKEPARLRPYGLRTAVDLAGLHLAGPAELRALPDGAPLPRTTPARTGGLRSPVLDLPLPGSGAPGAPEALPPDDGFDAGAPHAELSSRRATVTRLLQTLRNAADGALPDAFAQARALADAPGGATAVAPLIEPVLTQARAAVARAAREGLASPAWDEAEAALTNARILAPDYAETRCVEGELAERRGQGARAEEAWRACVDGRPERVEGWNGLARIRQQRGDLVGAETALRRALEAAPERWTSAHNLGVFLLGLHRYDEAEPLLDTGAAQQARGGLADDVPQLALARLYLETRRPELALAAASRAWDLRPSPEAAFRKGAARYELGQYEGAEIEFRRALELDPGYWLARGGLGQVQAQRGQYDLAAESFREVLARDPRNAAARENLRRLAERTGGDAPSP